MTFPKTPFTWVHWLLFLLLLLLAIFADAQSGPGRGPENRAERQAERKANERAQEALDRKLEQKLAQKLDSKLENQAAQRASDKAQTQLEKQLAKDASTPPGLLNAQSRAKGKGIEKALEASSKSHGKEDKGEASGEGKNAKTKLKFIQAEDGYYVADEALLLLEKSQLKALRERGVVLLSQKKLPSLGLYIVRIKQSDADTLKDTPSARNDLYFPSTGQATPLYQQDAQNFSAYTQSSARIGLLDTAVDEKHESLRSSRITQKSFVEGREATSHGTAIASILVGQSANYLGLMPEGQLYSASVFSQTESLGAVASAHSLLLGLDWLIQNKTKVINLSLSGPANPLLETAVKEASRRGITLVSAAGNSGPGAPPSYPAAYEAVVAVTAVNSQKAIWPLANRGNYVDFSAPGVDIYHAEAENYAASSGTSFAAAFITAQFAILRAKQDHKDAYAKLSREAEDIGAPGRDSTFGFGLVHGIKAAGAKNSD